MLFIPFVGFVFRFVPRLKTYLYNVEDIVKDKYGTRCKWTGPLEPRKTNKTGYWTIYLERQMKRDAFEATDVAIDYMDGSTWPNVPSSDMIQEQLNKVYNECNSAYMK